MAHLNLSRRARRGLIALAVALPALSVASLAGAAAWVHAHGGLASNLAAVVRHAAFLASGTESLPATLTPVQAATLAEESCTGCVYAASNDSEDGNGFSFALIEPGGRSSVVFDRDGSATLDRLRDEARVPTLWFSENGVETVSTDRAAVARAREICAPLEQLGREMGRVGGEMGEIGGEMGRYGGRLGELGGRLGGVAARLANARLNDDARERARLEAERDRLEAEMQRVRAEMKSRERGSVRARQGELRDRMRELSARHREEVRKARTELRELLHELRGTGRTTRVGHSI